MAGWHHWLHGLEFEWTPGDGDWQGGLACCDSWGCKDSDMTERLNWPELIVEIRLPCGSVGKESDCNVGDTGWNPRLGRSSGGNVYPLQYSCLEDAMDREAWWVIVHSVPSNCTWLCDFPPLFFFHFYARRNSISSNYFGDNLYSSTSFTRVIEKKEEK